MGNVQVKQCVYWEDLKRKKLANAKSSIWWQFRKRAVGPPNCKCTQENPLRITPVTFRIGIHISNNSKVGPYQLEVGLSLHL